MANNPLTEFMTDGRVLEKHLDAVHTRTLRGALIMELRNDHNLFNNFTLLM